MRTDFRLMSYELFCLSLSYCASLWFHMCAGAFSSHANYILSNLWTSWILSRTTLLWLELTFFSLGWIVSDWLSSTMYSFYKNKLWIYAHILGSLLNEGLTFVPYCHYVILFSKITSKKFLVSWKLNVKIKICNKIFLINILSYF